MNSELEGLSITDRAWYKPPAEFDDYALEYGEFGVTTYSCPDCMVRWAKPRPKLYQFGQDPEVSDCFLCNKTIQEW